MDDENEIPPPPPEGYDPLVWRELPLDIQRELYSTKNSQRKKIYNSKKLQQVSLNFSRNMEMEYWRDNSFPPTPESIDGRRGNDQDTPLIQQVCKCGKRMVTRQVSKAGINQGRYFYSCAGKQCNSFHWAEGVPHRPGVMNLQWKPFLSSDGWKMVFSSKGFVADDIIQGSIGNCWFLSAVAVLCERRDLLEKVMGETPLLTSSGQKFYFFASGEWKEIVVDPFLPCTDSETSKKRKLSSTGPLLAFSRAKHSQLWVSFLEKAYAKLYNCYDALHGGHIPEALFDLTGCPCESIHVDSTTFNSEETWAKLMNYRSLGFPMGCSTDFSGEGFVGNHAYSVLDIRELHDIQLGEQLLIKDFFSHSNITGESLPSSREEECLREVQLSGQLRLLRIRNPWGKREWTGNFSTHSSLWTTKLKKLLTETSSVSNASCSIDSSDGSFWITYTDFLRRYVTIDICKAHVPHSGKSSWKTQVVEDTIGFSGSDCDALSTHSMFILDVESTSDIPISYISLLQESKRGSFASLNPVKKSYYYSDLSAIIRSYAPNYFEGCIIGTIFSSPMRTTCPLELSLQPGRYSIQVLKFSPVLSPSSTFPSPNGVYLRNDQKYWVHIYSSQNLRLTKIIQSPCHQSSLPFHNCPRENLFHYLDEISSPSKNDSTTLTPLCSTVNLLYQVHINLYLLRGNGMNILFCRSNSISTPSADIIDLSNDDFPSSTIHSCSRSRVKMDYVVEIMAIRKPHCIIISPYLAPYQRNESTSHEEKRENTLQEMTNYMTKFQFHGMKQNQLQILGVIFDTRGSDSFEFIGEIYLHAMVIKCISHSTQSIEDRNHFCLQRSEVTDSGLPSHFRIFDCK